MHQEAVKEYLYALSYGCNPEIRQQAEQFFENVSKFTTVETQNLLEILFGLLKDQKFGLMACVQIRKVLQFNYLIFNHDERKNLIMNLMNGFEGIQEDLLKNYAEIIGNCLSQDLFNDNVTIAYSCIEQITATCINLWDTGNDDKSFL